MYYKREISKASKKNRKANRDYIFFTIPWPKVSFPLSAQKRECGIFGPDMVKNSIRTTGGKLASPHLVFAKP